MQLRQMSNDKMQLRQMSNDKMQFSDPYNIEKVNKNIDNISVGIRQPFIKTKQNMSKVKIKNYHFNLTKLGSNGVRKVSVDKFINGSRNS